MHDETESAILEWGINRTDYNGVPMSMLSMWRRWEGGAWQEFHRIKKPRVWRGIGRGVKNKPGHNIIANGRRTNTGRRVCLHSLGENSLVSIRLWLEFLEYLEISHETAAGRGRHCKSRMLNRLIERCCSLRDSVAGTVEGKDLSCSGNGERARAVAQRCVKRLVSRSRRQTEIRKFAKAGWGWARIFCGRWTEPEGIYVRFEVKLGQAYERNKAR